jgi:hypothetical protein
MREFFFNLVVVRWVAGQPWSAAKHLKVQRRHDVRDEGIRFFDPLVAGSL